MVLRHVPVPGGALAVETDEGSDDPVLAIHGISSQRRLWDWLRVEGPEIPLIAPDLRGRADSLAVDGVSSMRRHADDMVAVLDAIGLDAVHVCGMSMGGFIAVSLAATHPDRVKSLILVDGGFPMTPPPGLTEEMLPAVFKDRLGRLEQTWASLDEYLDFFTANTAPLLDREDPILRHYLEHDLVDGRVRLSAKALLEDAADVFFGENLWDDVKQPVRMVFAEWSSGANTTPAYTDETLQGVDARKIEGVDHAASIMSQRGAAATATRIREARTR